jgi:phosphoglycolate phosphatase
MYKNVIFDVDGTLLDTLEDIRLAINAALKECGYDKVYDIKEAHTLVGSGAYVLVKRAIAYKTCDKKEIDRVYKALMPYYEFYQGQHTKPFDGILEMLAKLKKSGVHLYVLTNKPDLLTQIIVHKFFANFIIDSQGVIDGFPIKPSNEFTTMFLNKNHLKNDESLFVGDSEVDITTGTNGNLDMVLVTWGYADYEHMDKTNASFVADSPDILFKFIIDNK